MKNGSKELIVSQEKKIRRWEKLLRVKFPRSYRQFLLERGSALVDGFRVLGIPREEGPTAKAEEPSFKEEKIKEVEPDFEKVKESSSCPLCRKGKEKGRLICYSCYKRYAGKAKRTPLSSWFREEFKRQQKEERQKEKKRKVKKEPKKKEPKKKELSVLDATEILRQRCRNRQVEAINIGLLNNLLKGCFFI